ncbi:MAG: outer membrane beta-barrel protein [Bacteroidetes bacterium]|nr:outer membrane beta-barrel protein [Bacteroidota bacterium]
MRYLIPVFILLFITGTIQAQHTIVVKGIVTTIEGKPLPNATVMLYYKGSADTLKAVSSENGSFRFSNAKAKNTGLIVSYVGYNTFTSSYDFTNETGEQEISNIILSPGIATLENVTLEASKIQIKEDTVSYRIDSTMYRKNDNVEELLKKLPGVQVDKDGTVTAQGKEVTKVKVNGKEFFGGDVRTATRELNADMVDKIQIIDDYGDQAAFTGIKEGDPSKTMNIQLKKDKNKGYFGNVTAGGGTDNRYVTSLSVNRFNNDQQISLIGNLNNNNASPFNFGGLGGAIGNMMVSMARSMGIGQGGGGVAATLGNFNISDGIGTTKSIGLNYTDDYGKKVSTYGSYSYSQKAFTTVKSIAQQNFSNTLSTTNNQLSNDYTITDNHRFSYNIEVKPDSFNSIKFSPSFTYRKSNSNFNENHIILNGNDEKLNDGFINEEAISKLPNYSGTLLFNHRFLKKGRTLSINLNGGTSGTEGTDDIRNINNYYLPQGTGPVPVNLPRENHQFIPQDNTNRNYGGRVSYIEPLSKRRSLEFNYAYNYQYTGNDRKTYKVDSSLDKIFVDSLSSVYNNVYVTNRLGVNFRTNTKKYNYTVGLAVQPGSITSSNDLNHRNDYTQHLVNFYPVIRFAYNFSRSRSLNLNYNGSTNQPGYAQLNPVPDNSNSQYITIGNPDLKPEFTNTFSSRYNNFDFVNGNVFFGSINFSFTQDKIVTNTRQLGFGTQETRYKNANGFYTVTAFYNMSRPQQNRKYVVNWGGNVIYNNNISFIDNRKNTARNWVIGQRLSEDFKIKKWLETNATVNFSLNSTKNTAEIPGLLNTTIRTWILSNSTRIFIREDFVVSVDLTHTFNSGYTGNVNANPRIINATVEKQFLKKKNLSVKLQAYDILNENNGVSRTVKDNYITDTRTNRLARYYMLTLVFRLNKFFGDQQQMRMGGMMMQGPPPGMRP